MLFRIKAPHEENLNEVIEYLDDVNPAFFEDNKENLKITHGEQTRHAAGEICFINLEVRISELTTAQLEQLRPIFQMLSDLISKVGGLDGKIEIEIESEDDVILLKI